MSNKPTPYEEKLHKMISHWAIYYGKIFAYPPTKMLHAFISIASKVLMEMEQEELLNRELLLQAKYLKYSDCDTDLTEEDWHEAVRNEEFIVGPIVDTVLESGKVRAFGILKGWAKVRSELSPPTSEAKIPYPKREDLVKLKGDLRGRPPRKVGR
jgi:hypothetical protein